MAVAMIGPKFYAWDDDGEPLAFGKLFTYQTLTTIPKTTWTSENKLVENTNPVILNGEGYAEVYLDGSYNMELYDANDNLVWTADPVSSASPTEWVNCSEATYVSTNKYQLKGDQSHLYDNGRRVRLDQGGATFDYGTVSISNYSGGFTTVTLIESIVTVSIASSCTALVGTNSLVIGSQTNYEFATVDDAKQGLTVGGISVDIQPGMSVITQGYRAAGDGGGDRYLAAPPQAVDGLADHLLDNSNVILLQITSATDIRSFGAEGNSDGTVGSGRDNTANIQAMADRKGTVRTPNTGKFRITGQIDYVNGVFEGESRTITSETSGSTIICDDSAFAGPFFVHAAQMRNMVLRGTSKLGTGLAIRNINQENFLGWTTYENLRVQNFNLGVFVGNVFIMDWDSVIVEDNVYGVDVDPFNDAGDNGYVTTVYWNDVVIRANDDYGLRFEPDLKSPNINFTNLNIEDNNQVSGTYQMILRNADPFWFENLYLENSPGTDVIQFGGGNVGTISSVFINNAGDLQFFTGTAEVDFDRVKQVDGVIAATGGSNQKLKFNNSSIAFNGGTLPAIANLTLTRTTADGTYYDHYAAGSGVNFQLGTTSKIASIRHETVAFTGKTVNANSVASLVTDVSRSGIMFESAGFAWIRGVYEPFIHLEVQPGTSGSTNFYSVLAFNGAGSDVTLADGVLDIFFIKSGN